MTEKRNIFISPLDWGLGHITRVIPVIRMFRDRGHHVVLGGGRNAMAILKTEFPDLEFEPLPSYTIRYPQKGNLIWALLKQMPSFFANIRREKRRIHKIIHKYDIDVVISDNRYGLHHTDVYSVFITHQLMLKLPASLGFLETWVFRRHQKMIARFDTCWVPDFAKPPYLAGDLAHLYKPGNKTAFVGPLSRFGRDLCEEDTTDFSNDLIAVLSGPEPARTRFESLLLEKIPISGRQCLIVRGLPTEAAIPETLPAGITMVNHLPTCDLQSAMLNARCIIARAGYSTIMDLVALRRTAVLIPTPGQTEQEYLASYYNERKLFLCISEKDLNISEALNQLTLYQWNLNTRTTTALTDEAIRIEKLVAGRK